MDPRERRPPAVYEDEETGSDSHTDTLTLAREVLRRAPGITNFDSTPEQSETLPPLQPVSVELAPLDAGAFEARYDTRSVLGEGGMGAVLLCKDRNVGREVAMKVMRAEHGARTDLRARFEREARVQGQLEHPSVVPVYDLGIRPDGREYFTMKRLRGQTFHEIVWMLKQGDLQTLREFPRRKLLSAFSSAGLAVAFAHSRGVLHRDLKPANVMVGDFGEVHILDWGLAKIVGARVAESEEESVEPPPGSSDHETIIGEVVGTAGYMAPEQVRGEIDKLDGRADVYALGAILFELLTLERLHPGDNPVLVLASTLDGSDARPSRRTPYRNVPPELEEICVRATALDPDDRYPTVRELVSAVERYLDDNRGIERRREQAAEHAAAAREEARIARAGGKGAPLARERAVREASAALGNDPTNTDAMGVLVQMLLGAPREVTAEARKDFEAARQHGERASRRATFTAYAVWAACAPAIAALGVRDLRLAGALGAALLVAVGLSWIASTARLPSGARFAAYVAGSAAIGLSGLLFGWATLVPGMAAMHAVTFALHGERRLFRPAILLAALTVIAPFALEAFGVIRSSYVFEAGAIKIVPRLSALPAKATLLFLVFSSLGVIVAPALAVARFRRIFVAAEERVFMSWWNLRRLTPKEPQESSAAAEMS